MNLREHVHSILKLRWPLLGTHAIATVITLAIVTPLITGSIQLGLRLSGKPALSDADIAMFLLSPGGFIIFLTVGSLLITAAVLELSAMLWVLAGAEYGRGTWGIRAFQAVAMRVPKLLHLALHIILRLLVIIVPPVLVVGAIALSRLTEFDINYYLKERPQEFRNTVLIGVPILVLAGILLINRLLAWSMVLPLVLFQDVPAQASFGISAHMTRGHRVRLLWMFLLWALIAGFTALTVTVLATGLAQVAELFGQAGIGALAAALAVVIVIWVVTLIFTTTLTRAGFAALLLDRFTLFGGTLQEDTRSYPPLSRSRMTQVGVLAVFSIGSAIGVGYFMVDSMRPVDSAEVIAHRGAAGERPENTMASVHLALEQDTDWIEIDVQESADGEIVVFHDSDFMKTASNPLKLWEATRADLDEIDIGSWYDPEYADQRVPLLSDVLLAAKDKAHVLIELKYYGHDTALEQRVAEIVEETGMVDQMAIMSLKLEGIEKMRKLRPDWPMGLLASAAVGDLTKLDIEFLAVNGTIANQPFLRHARNKGMPVMVWTINDMVGMSQILSRGASGLITDYPARAREVIAVRAEMNAVERLLLELADLLGLEVSLPTRDTEGA